MRSYGRDLLFFLGGCLLLGLYLCSKVDWEDVLNPAPTTPVHLNGKIAPKPHSLPNVTQIAIPQEVYNSIESNISMSRYITGNQKYILVISFDGKPNLRVFKKALNTLLKEKGYQEYYRKHYVDSGAGWISCQRHNTCPELWLKQNCIQKVCIIQPHKKQVVADSSADPNQLEALLEKYKEW